MTARTKVDPARRGQPGSSPGSFAAAGVLAMVVAAVVVVWGAARLVDPAVPGPPAFLLGLATGAVSWPGTPATVVATVGLLVVAGVAVLVLRAALRRPAGRVRGDDKAPSMARPSDLEVLLPAGAHADAVRLDAAHACDGVPVGELLPGRAVLRSPLEWTQLWLMGTRSGKTTTVCVRQVCETRGPVIATSNKRDLLDMTRGLRSRLGTVWVFDPQGLAGEPPNWWWNPLSYVTGVGEAMEMAGLFAAASRTRDDKGDAYFDPEGQAYLAGMLYAAAVAGQPITKVLDWVTRASEEPAQVLDMAGFSGQAKLIRAANQYADKQRDGIAATAKKMVAWLGNPDLLPWISPTGPDDDRAEFDPTRFVQTRQTLQVLSMEGPGSSRAVTAALTVATVRAAERLASHSPRGRLPTPLMVVLDEAANIVRWPELPDLYSHYGSRGILVSTFLQSWSQGVEVWGRDGMEKLWSAANIRVVGSGLAEDGFLESVSRLIGDHDVVTHDVSQSPRSGGLFSSGRSTSTRLQRERIFDPAQLQGLPRGRAVMLSAGAPAALIGLTHYSTTDYADDIRASEDYYTHLAVAPPTSTHHHGMTPT